MFFDNFGRFGTSFAELVRIPGTRRGKMRPSTTPSTTDLSDFLHEISGPDTARHQIVGDRHLYPGPLAGHEEHLDRVLVLVPEGIH